MIERNGNPVPAGFKSESHAAQFIKSRGANIQPTSGQPDEQGARDRILSFHLSACNACRDRFYVVPGVFAALAVEQFGVAGFLARDFS